MGFILVEEHSPPTQKVPAMPDDLDTSLWVVAIQLVENFVVYLAAVSCRSQANGMTLYSRERTLRFSKATPSGAQVRSTVLLSCSQSGFRSYRTTKINSPRTSLFETGTES